MGDPRLELDGEHVHAKLLPGRGTNGGDSLLVDGTTQSHVNPRDPRDLQLEYTRLVAGIIDGCREAGRALRVLHLGAGALTLARYVAATRPGSVQHVVELHRELLEFVLDVVPLDPEVALTVEFEDARAAVEHAVRTAGGYDLGIVDVFSGDHSPGHLSTLEFLAGRSLGNLVFAAADTALPAAEILSRADTGPRRVEILSGAKFLAFVGDASVRRDGQYQ